MSLTALKNNLIKGIIGHNAKLNLDYNCKRKAQLKLEMGCERWLMGHVNLMCSLDFLSWKIGQRRSPEIVPVFTLD